MNKLKIFACSGAEEFAERVWSYITDSCDNFLDNLEDILEFSIYAIPNVGLLVIAYIILVKIVRKIRKKKKNKKDKTNIEDETQK